jgi:hypothetical protein
VPAAPPGEERAVDPRFAASVGATPDPPRNIVQRVRVAGGDVEALIAELLAPRL